MVKAYNIKEDINIRSKKLGVEHQICKDENKNYNSAQQVHGVF